MTQRRRGSTASKPMPQATLETLLKDLPEPAQAFEPKAEKVQIGPVGGSWRADQEAWVKNTNRWGK